jgi:phage baseplate assembly protein gpV/phage protein D
VNRSRSTNGVYTLPQVTVEADGRSLTPAEMCALGQVRVQQRLSQPTLCEITFYDPPGPLDTASDLEPGTELRITLSGQMDPLFVGQVTAVEHVYGATHEHQVHVRSYDRLHQLRKRQSVRAHVQVTPHDLAQELVADLGLSVEAAEPGPLWQRLIQHQQSDLELLFEVTEQCGLYFTLVDDVLRLLTLEGSGDPLPLILGDSLHEARIETSGEPACRTVTASGWNPLLVETYEGQTGNARVGRDVSAQVAPDLVGASGECSLPDETVQSVAHAEALAQAELDRRVAREVTLWGIAEGDPRLRPGTPVEIENVADTLSGRYVLTAVTHTIDGYKGFVSELSTTPPPPRRRQRSAIAALGTVTRVDDPQGLGRVRVCLPTYGEVETEWMHVLSAGAGADKGLVILPDVDDRVLVLFSQEAPGLGVVLGGLYGMEGPLDSGVEGNAVKRYTILTSGGHRVHLDDEEETIYLEDSTGSYVALSPESVHLHATVDLVIEAPEQAIVIRGQTIDFERG